MWGRIPLLLRTGRPLALWLISQHCWGCLCLPTLYLERRNLICCAITVSTPHITCMTPQSSGTTLSPNTGNAASVAANLDRLEMFRLPYCLLHMEPSRPLHVGVWHSATCLVHSLSLKSLHLIIIISSFLSDSFKGSCSRIFGVRLWRRKLFVHIWGLALWMITFFPIVVIHTEYNLNYVILRVRVLVDLFQSVTLLFPGISEETWSCQADTWPQTHRSAGWLPATCWIFVRSHDC